MIDSGGTDGKLENYILQNAKGDSKSNQQTIVEAIFITHAHSDHFLGIVNLINNSDLSNIKINNIYFNFPSYDWLDMIDKENDKRDELQQALTKAETQGTKIHSDIKAGDTFKIDELTFKILRVVDTAITYNGVNNSSAVIKVYTPSLNVLFLGDLGIEGGRQLLNSEFAEEVPSDIVQVSYHGQNGVNEEFYKKVKAKIALWCAPEWVYNPDEDHQFLNTEHTKRWLRELGCENNFVAKNGDCQLEFTKNSLKIKL